MVLTRTSPVVTRGTSESVREKIIRLRHNVKIIQQQNIAKPIKENKFNDQSTGETIEKNSPILPTTQNQHVIPDENGILNVPNLVEEITQMQPHLQPHVIETEINAVLDATT